MIQTFSVPRAKTIIERLHSVKNDSSFEIVAFFPHRIGGEKARQFQTYNIF